jgi:hypothetical protein
VKEAYTVEGQEARNKKEFAKRWEVFVSVLKSLPLDGCRREVCNPQTGEVAWRAPDNKLFRITGQFDVIDTEESREEIDYFTMPAPSLEKLKVELSEDYEKFLKKARGNKKKALRFLVEMCYEDPPLYTHGEFPAESFVGKWLVINPDLEDIGFATKTTKQPDLEVKIKGDIEAWSKKEYGSRLLDINPQSEIITDVAMDSDVITNYWRQPYADAVLGKFKIELVDTIDKTPELNVPTFRDSEIDKEKLIIPDVRIKRRAEKRNEDLFVKFAGEAEGKGIKIVTPSSESLFSLKFSIAFNNTKIIVPKNKTNP